MKAIKIFFTISLFFVICAFGVCVSDLSHNVFTNSSYAMTAEAIARPVYIDEETSLAVNSKENTQPAKQTNNYRGVTKTLLIILAFAIVFPIVISLFLLNKFNSLVKNADNSTEQNIQETVDKLQELQDKFKDTFDVNNIEQDSQKLVKELNDFMNELSKEELDSVEIKPVKKNTQTPKKNYIQKEKAFVKPKLHEPLLISQQPISKTKGFYLVDCGKDKALVGYINDEIFLLNKFQKIQNKAIQVRFTERIGHRNIYMVKNGSYKALVQVEKENMKVLLEM